MKLSFRQWLAVWLCRLRRRDWIAVSGRVRIAIPTADPYVQRLDRPLPDGDDAVLYETVPVNDLPDEPGQTVDDLMYTFRWEDGRPTRRSEIERILASTEREYEDEEES